MDPTQAREGVAMNDHRLLPFVPPSGPPTPPSNEVRAWWQGRLVVYEADVFRVQGIGATSEEGETFAHLTSTTRFRPQRNGQRPIQIGVWLSLATIEIKPSST